MKARNADVEKFLVATLVKVRSGGGVENWRSERYNKIVREQKAKPYLPGKLKMMMSDIYQLLSPFETAKEKVAQTIICSRPALLVTVN